MDSSKITHTSEMEWSDDAAHGASKSKQIEGRYRKLARTRRINKQQRFIAHRTAQNKAVPKWSDVSGP